MKVCYVYMVKCSDGSIYTGHTADLENRLYQHNAGELSDYTSRRRPVELIWSDAFPNRDQAFQVERQIKNWSRAKKLALAKGDFDLLSALAKKRTWDQYRRDRL